MNNFDITNLQPNHPLQLAAGVLAHQAVTSGVDYTAVIDYDDKEVMITVKIVSEN
ncbi:unnamed protein product [marine sediment metagenome]|uniref:Uncharacterized protein n=1 Tax=marine sediment metagenome TaxID=412755 RepID=X0RRR8_9ZZZZ